jgi:hypothetical protein
MDFIIVVVYIAIFAIGVFLDIRKKKKVKKSARDSVNETINRHTESNASRPDLKSFKEAEERSRKIKEEFEKLSKKINAAKHTSEQLLKEKMKMNSSLGGNSQEEGAAVTFNLSEMNRKRGAYQDLKVESEVQDFSYLSDLDSPEELRKAFLYSEILNRRYN